jgi:FdhE protein
MYLGWTVLARYLRPVVDNFATWRNEKRRLLACGRCKSRWWFQRIGRPFCDVENGHRLRVLTVEEEGGLRIEYCNSSGGYLETYDGQGSESVLLADWTSIHLDLIASDRGLKRFGASLYEL